MHIYIADPHPQAHMELLPLSCLSGRWHVLQPTLLPGFEFETLLTALICFLSDAM